MRVVWFLIMLVGCVDAQATTNRPSPESPFAVIIDECGPAPDRSINPGSDSYLRFQLDQEVDEFLACAARVNEYTCAPAPEVTP